MSGDSGHILKIANEIRSGFVPPIRKFSALKHGITVGRLLTNGSKKRHTKL